MRSGAALGARCLLLLLAAAPAVRAQSTAPKPTPSKPATAKPSASTSRKPPDLAD